MTVDILVADDELPVLEELTALLGTDERVGRIFRARTGAEALRMLSEAAVDVAFLDIHMPTLSGLDLARALQQFHRRPAVVFVTADEARAVDAFDVAAVDYLLKPVRPERLRVALGRAIDAAGTQAAVVADEKIPVTSGGHTRMVRRSDVRWVQAQGDYARLWTDRGDHLVRVPISELETRWEQAGFLRVHRSYLVHIDAIIRARLTGTTPTVSLAEIELPVSRRLLGDVRERLLRS